jgi:ubiquinone/menaquinone biosynthesis C-methylase UbiE
VTRLRRVEGAAERMDQPGVDHDQLLRSLRQVAAVNRWLGGRRALLRHLDRVLPAGPVTILDVGTGSADLPRAISARLGGRAPLRVIGLDRHPITLDAARRGTAASDAIRLCRGDALALPFADRSVDFALLSMTLHHFDGDQQLAVLRELGRVARRAVIVGDLVRSWPAYLAARLLAATVWRSNPITRHDGPLSVRRAFTASELRELGRQAGLRAVEVGRYPFFRLLMHGLPPAAASPGIQG